MAHLSLSLFQRNIASIEQFASLPPVERRKLVRNLSDEEYSDILAVCSTFPHVAIEAETQGQNWNRDTLQYSAMVHKAHAIH